MAWHVPNSGSSLNDSLVVPYDSALDEIDYDKTWTIEYWFYGYELATSNDWVISKYNAQTDGWMIRHFGMDAGERNIEFLGIDTGNDLLQAYSDTNIETYDGAWHHFCITYDGSGGATGLTFYIDGSVTTTKVSNTPLTTTMALTDAMYIFNNRNLDRGRQSAMAEFKLWNVELTANQVKNSKFGKLIPDSRMIAYYRMDEDKLQDGPNSTTAVDIASNAMHAYDTNTVLYHEGPPIQW